MAAEIDEVHESLIDSMRRLDLPVADPRPGAEGHQGSGLINVVTTAAKLVPIFLFILLGIPAFNYDKFTLNFWGAVDAQGQGGLGSVLEQVKSTMLVPCR